MEGYFSASYRASHLPEIHPSDLESDNTQNEIDKLSV